MRTIPFVFGLLIILGMMCSARWEQWISRSVLHRWEEEVSSETLFQRWNARQAMLYENASKEKEPEDELEAGDHYDPYTEEVLDAIKEEKEQLFSYVNLSILAKKEEASASPWTAFSKKLLGVLYGDQLFFQELKAQIPDAEEQLLMGIAQFLQGREKPLLRKQELIYTPFEEEELRIAFCKMMQGTRGRGRWEENGYPKLTDYFTLGTNLQKPLSVYLAPPETLLALFDSKEKVQEIIRKRKEIHRRVGKREIGTTEGEKQLEALCLDALPPEIPRECVDFRVSLSRP